MWSFTSLLVFSPVVQGKSEIGFRFEINSQSPPFNNGIMIDIFKHSGNIPVENEILIAFPMIVKALSGTFAEILSQPDVFLLVILLRVYISSSEFVAPKKNLLQRYSLNKQTDLLPLKFL